MKAKLLLPFVVLFLMTACSTDPKAKARKSIEAYLQTKLNDPKSYEFMELDSLSTITRSDSLKNALIEEELVNLHSFSYDEEKHKLNVIYDYNIPVNELTALGEKIVKVQTEDSIIKAKYAKAITPETDKVATGYRTKLKFRSKNAMGALVIGDYSFKLDNNFNVIDASSSKE